jgi:HEAT repeat protein
MSQHIPTSPQSSRRALGICIIVATSTLFLVVIGILLHGFWNPEVASPAPESHSLSQLAQKHASSVLGSNTSPQLTQNQESPTYTNLTVEELVQQLRVSSDQGISEEVELLCSRIANLGDEGVPALKQLLWSTDSSLVKEAAAHTLSEIGSKLAVSVLVDYLSKETNPEFRDLIARSLQRLDKVDGVPALLGLLSTTSDYSVATESRLALVSIAESQEYPGFVQSVVNAYAKIPRGSVQSSNVLSLLQSIRAPSAVTDLDMLLRTETDPLIRQAAFDALTEIGSQDSLGTLVKIAQQQSSSTDKQLALQAITHITNPDLLGSLLMIQRKYPGSEVSLAASSTIARIMGIATENAKNVQIDKELKEIEARKQGMIGLPGGAH